MRGGAAIRRAPKVAGLGGSVLSGSLRGAAAPAAAPPGQAVRKSSIPVSEMPSSSSSTRVGADVAAVQRPMPRVVFTGVPSLNEAKEATDELKDALDGDYLSSPKSSESRELTASDELSGLSVAVGTNGTLSAPNHALKPFRLPCTSTEALNVVASIVSDPDVMNVFMDVVQEIMESIETRVEFQEPDNPEKPKDSSARTWTRDFGKWCMGIYKKVEPAYKKVELTAVDLVTRLSSKVKPAYKKVEPAYKKVELTAVDLVTCLSSKLDILFNYALGINGDEKEDLTDITFGLTSFLGLATLVVAVMVVLLKRVLGLLICRAY